MTCCCLFSERDLVLLMCVRGNGGFRVFSAIEGTLVVRAVTGIFAAPHRRPLKSQIPTSVFARPKFDGLKQRAGRYSLRICRPQGAAMPTPGTRTQSTNSKGASRSLHTVLCELLTELWFGYSTARTEVNSSTRARKQLPGVSGV